jgi:tetratricopeptide (TPR) repeat protein
MFSSRFVRVLVCGVSITCAVPARAATQWLKLQTRDVEILSDASQADVVEFATGYLAYREAFKVMLAPPLAVPPTRFVLVRDSEELDRLVPVQYDSTRRTVSVSLDIDGTILNAIAVGGDRQTALQQVYEFETVWSLGRAGYQLPLWMSQGAGEVLEEIWLKKGMVEVGDTHGRYSWSSATVPWPRFFEIDTSAPEYQGRDPRAHFHPQAWALMHRILVGADNPATAFTTLARRLQQVSMSAAVEEALGVPADKFDAEIKRELRSGRRFRFSFDGDALKKSLTVVRASDFEVHLAKSDLLFGAQRNNEAELELAAAQSLLPSSVLVQEARARSALRDRQPEEAAARYREAIAAGSTNPTAYLRSAEARLREMMSGDRMEAGGGGNGVSDAVREIEHALQLQPGRAEAYELLGKAFYLAPTVTEADARQLDWALSAGAAGLPVRYYRGMVFQRLDQPDAALTELEAVATSPIASPDLRKLAVGAINDHVIKAVLAKIEQKVREHDFAAARAELARCTVSPHGTNLSRTFAKATRWLDEREAWAAVKNANEAGDPEKVRTAARTFIERFPDSELTSKARALLQESSAAPAAGT